MKQMILYLVTIVIWGSTWIAIKFQLGPVDPMVSVIYRFGLASVLLLAFCRVRGLSLKFSLKDHCFMALMGIFLFSVNYWLVYLAEQYLTSGLVAVLFSSLVFFNMANSAFFMGAPVARKTIIGALAGIIGITLIFLPEIRAFDASDNGLTGVAIGMLSVFLASLGNIASARNTRHKIPVVQANAFGMTYGTLVLVIVALCLGKPFSFSLSPAYTGSLVFLAVFGSIVAFSTYLTLVGSMGADKAAYAIMVVPVVALVISSFAEGYVWTVPAVAGLSLVLAGNFLALARRPG
ncbi:MAG TPA: EamA family transporter [Desulfobacteraceae bacterium]|nr:EamA family transporter [Desulfobacteraceae bacterium]